MAPHQGRQAAAARLAALARQLSSALSGGSGPRTVRAGDTVFIKCTGWYVGSDGTEHSADLFADDEAVVTAGATDGLLMPALGHACIGLPLDGAREFRVEPSDPGHPAPRRDEQLVDEIPTGGATVAVGATVRIRYKGVARPATVLAFDAVRRVARVDMNDPLAGRALRARVTVLRFDAAAPPADVSVPDDADVPPRVLSRAELSRHDGVASEDVWVSLCGYVYDVTSSARMYGPGGAYHFLAGHDASVALGKFKIDPSLCDQPWAALSDGEKRTLSHYSQTFQAKYPLVGRLGPGQ